MRAPCKSPLESLDGNGSCSLLLEASLLQADIDPLIFMLTAEGHGGFPVCYGANHLKLGDTKRQPFYYAPRSCESGIWTEHIRDGFSLLPV